MFLPGITKLQRKLLLLNLRIGREVRIRRDSYAMGGNGVLARVHLESGTRRDRWCLASIFDQRGQG